MWIITKAIDRKYPHCYGLNVYRFPRISSFSFNPYPFKFQKIHDITKRNTWDFFLYLALYTIKVDTRKSLNQIKYLFKFFSTGFLLENRTDQTTLIEIEKSKLCLFTIFWANNELWDLILSYINKLFHLSKTTVNFTRCPNIYNNMFSFKI